MADPTPRLIGKGFTLSIEDKDGRVFVPVAGARPASSPSMPTGDVELTGTFTFASWVDRWKLMAWAAPRL